jgi:hypothetical protein
MKVQCDTITQASVDHMPEARWFDWRRLSGPLQKYNVHSIWLFAFCPFSECAHNWMDQLESKPIFLNSPD